MNIEIENAIKAIKANYPDSRYTELRKGLDLAIAALEKQIPKKLMFMQFMKKMKKNICVNVE